MIRKVVIATGVTTRLAGSALGVAGYANSTDGTGNTATFNFPTAVTMHNDSIYVADTGNNSIRKIDISSGVVTLIAGSTTGLAGSVDALNGTDARFNQPTGITTDGTNLYVADSANNTVRKIVISSGSVTTLAGTATVAGSVDGTGTTASFNQPARITTDGSNLYVTDFRNGTVRMIVIATKTVTTLAGTARTLGNVDGTGSAAKFNQPNGITTDGANLYVTDTFYNTIRKIIISTGETSTLPGSFITPIGITTDGTSLFVAETYTVKADSNNNPVYTYGNNIRRIQ
jgi:sugar lactone lactonase YvrE